jgi:hypothetical protein
MYNRANRTLLRRLNRLAPTNQPFTLVRSAPTATGRTQYATRIHTREILILNPTFPTLTHRAQQRPNPFDTIRTIRRWLTTYTPDPTHTLIGEPPTPHPTPPHPTPDIYNTHTWRQTATYVIARDGHQCTHPGCGARTNLQADHITPLSKGGAAFDPDNLRTLCATHHARRTNADQTTARHNQRHDSHTCPSCQAGQVFEGGLHTTRRW